MHLATVRSFRLPLSYSVESSPLPCPLSSSCHMEVRVRDAGTGI